MNSTLKLSVSVAAAMLRFTYYIFGNCDVSNCVLERVCVKLI